MAKILICDPHETLAAALAEAIRRSGLSTVVVTEAGDVLSALEREQPALVVLDLQLGEGAGLEICRTLRESSAGELVPILFVGTGEDGVKNFGDALAEGGDYYFQKPVDMHKVVSKIRTYVGADKEGPAEVKSSPARMTVPDGGVALAGRVEQMLDLGTTFQQGRSVPPEKIEGERAEELEQQLFGDEAEKPTETAEPQADLPTREEETTKVEAEPKGAAVDAEDADQLLPPADEQPAGTVPAESAGFPQKTGKIDEPKPVLKAPEGKEPAEDESSKAVLSRAATELRETREEDATDDLEKETAAWSEIEEELERKEGKPIAAPTGEEEEEDGEEQARREAEEQAKQAAKEKARREAEERAKQAAKEQARREAEEQAKQVAKEKARREAEERAKQAAKEQARREAEEKIGEELEVKTSRELDAAETLAVEGPEGTRREVKRPVGVDEGYISDDDEELEAESLWRDVAEEKGWEMGDLAQRASDYVEKRIEDQEESSNLHLSLVPDSEEEQPSVLTSCGGEKLVELLQREAKLARETAATEPDGDQKGRVATVPGLPPRPGEKMVTIRAGLREEEKEDPAVEKEKTRELDPPVPEAKIQQKKASPGRDPGDSGDGGGGELAGEEDFFVPDMLPEFSAPDPEHADLGGEMVPAVLWRFYRQAVTGRVVFRSGGDTKDVFFENGIPIGVRSSQTVDRLEEVLFREGLIDRAAYAEARIKGIAQPRALAAHLVERGLLKPDELFPLVRRHLEDCLLGLFEWTEGSTSYEKQYALDAEKVRLARPLPALILEGIRRKFLLRRLVKVLGSPASLLAPVPSEDRSPRVPRLAQLGFLKEEREVLNLVNGFRPIEEIVFLSGHNATTVYRVLTACVVTGLLAVAVRGVRGGDEDADETLQRSLEIGRRRLEAKYEQINQASYFEILGVTEEATTYEIDAAYKRLTREFHPMNFAHTDFKNLQTKLDAIHQTLDEAHEVLADELLREGYRQSLS